MTIHHCVYKLLFLICTRVTRQELIHTGSYDCVIKLYAEFPLVSLSLDLHMTNRTSLSDEKLQALVQELLKILVAFFNTYLSYLETLHILDM